MVKSYQKKLRDTLVDCTKSKRCKQVESLFQLLLFKSETDEVNKQWFDLTDGAEKPKMLISEMRCSMVKNFLSAVYFFLDEKTKSSKLKQHDLINFLLTCKVTTFITTLLEGNDNLKALQENNLNSSVTYMTLVLIKRILEHTGHKQTSHSNQLLNGNVVEMLLDILNSSEKNLCMVAAVDILCCFSLQHREACERISKSNGLVTLSQFIKKDDAQKMLLSSGIEKDFFCFDDHMFAYNFYHIECCVNFEEKEWKVPETINRESGVLLLQIGFELKKASMKILMQIADLNNRFRLLLYNQERCMKPILSWLSNPACHPSTHIMFQFSSHIISNLLLSEEIAIKLINNNNLINTLDVGLYSAGWHISRQFQMLVHGIAKQGGTVREKLAENKGIFEALVCQMYSIDEDVQPALIALVAELAQGRKTATELHKAGCTPQLLIDTGHFYGHSYRRQIERARCGFVKHVKSWRKEERLIRSERNEDSLTIRHQVENLKNNGNDEFKKQKYERAVEFYTQALKICPVRIKCPDGENCPSWDPRMGVGNDVHHWWVLPATLFANRAQCHLQMGKWQECIRDSTRSICSCWIPCDEGGPTRSSIFLKAVYRRARAWYEMEDYLKALNDISCCHELEPNDQMFTDMYKECLLLYRKYYRRELVRHCGNCGAGEGIQLRRCAGCCEVYCSKKCQTTDWTAGHKELCAKFSTAEE
ncbi:uncharacterized protein LOC130624307 isoform X1 [Hydractinia symbiolongicarpus]|uniref:uncharacterized protein LOC130624307 isoform X1 n=2 Tax=Hydractinia symbiolongicarpus TaxID=13093 RepID=UPI002551620A|nr:uncharacterized protein LOC130624307 isoform X1 [Hydractinia symbiolongicarpus]